MAAIKPLLLHAAEVLGGWLTPFIPAAIGSAIAQAWEPGLGWRQRLVQWAVGVFVSSYVTMGVSHVFGWHPHVANAVGFVIGMIAFKSVEPLRLAFVAGMAGGFGAIPDIVRSWGRKPGAPPTGEGE